MGSMSASKPESSALSGKKLVSSRSRSLRVASSISTLSRSCSLAQGMGTISIRYAGSVLLKRMTASIISAVRAYPSDVTALLFSENAPRRRFCRTGLSPLVTRIKDGVSIISPLG